MVPSVLRPWNSVQIYVNAEPVFTGPLDSLEEIPDHWREMVRVMNKEAEERNTDVQEVLARNGSSPRTSIAHQAMGIRKKLRPAPAISAKSFSVCE